MPRTYPLRCLKASEKLCCLPPYTWRSSSTTTSCWSYQRRTQRKPLRRQTSRWLGQSPNLLQLWSRPRRTKSHRIRLIAGQPTRKIVSPHPHVATENPLLLLDLTAIAPLVLGVKIGAHHPEADIRIKAPVDLQGAASRTSLSHQGPIFANRSCPLVRAR